MPNFTDNSALLLQHLACRSRGAAGTDAPQELKALSPEEEIIFVEGISYPIKCSKIRYYQDNFFKPRLLPNIDVPKLKIWLSQVVGQKSECHHMRSNHCPV